METLNGTDLEPLDFGPPRDRGMLACLCGSRTFHVFTEHLTCAECRSEIPLEELEDNERQEARE